LISDYKQGNPFNRALVADGLPNLTLAVEPFVFDFDFSFGTYKEKVNEFLEKYPNELISRMVRL